MSLWAVLEACGNGRLKQSWARAERGHWACGCRCSGCSQETLMPVVSKNLGSGTRRGLSVLEALVPQLRARSSLARFALRLARPLFPSLAPTSQALRQTPLVVLLPLTSRSVSAGGWRVLGQLSGDDEGEVVSEPGPGPPGAPGLGWTLVWSHVGVEGGSVASPRVQPVLAQLTGQEESFCIWDVKEGDQENGVPGRGTKAGLGQGPDKQLRETTQRRRVCLARGFRGLSPG